MYYRNRVPETTGKDCGHQQCMRVEEGIARIFTWIWGWVDARMSGDNSVFSSNKFHFKTRYEGSICHAMGHMLHVWHICHHCINKDIFVGKCKVFHTWSIWVKIWISSDDLYNLYPSLCNWYQLRSDDWVLLIASTAFLRHAHSGGRIGSVQSDPQVAWDLVIFVNSPLLPYLDVFFLGRQVIFQIFRVYWRLHDVLMASAIWDTIL